MVNLSPPFKNGSLTYIPRLKHGGFTFRHRKNIVKQLFEGNFTQNSPDGEVDDVGRNSNPGSGGMTKLVLHP